MELVSTGVRWTESRMFIWAFSTSAKEMQYWAHMVLKPRNKTTGQSTVQTMFKDLKQEQSLGAGVPCGTVPTTRCWGFCSERNFLFATQTSWYCYRYAPSSLYSQALNAQRSACFCLLVLLHLLFCFESQVSLCCPDWNKTQGILLSQPSDCWDYLCVPLYPA